MAVPAAPSITIQNIGDNVVRLKVSLPDTADSYKVYRNTHALATTELAAGVTGRFYLDGAVVDDTMYWYRVKATNGDGDSVFSNEVNANAGQPVEAPTGTITGALRINRTRISQR
jgi:fibronectin type 3 domain-containing protein